MRILHLASGNRWTGAAAPAFAEVESLRGAGVDAHYAFVGGYKLESKIGHLPFAHASVQKAQNPIAFARSVSAIEQLGAFDIIHAHLTYDHLLAIALARRSGARVARTFHSRRVLRSDPLSRSLHRRSTHLFAVNATFDLHGSELVFTPPPVDHGQFSPSGPTVRQRYGFDQHDPLVMAIGKLSPDRGFELALAAFAALRAALPNARMMIVGHGPHQPTLEALVAELDLHDAVVFAGYHEADLAEHYRAADVLFFTAAGSDEGHRAVLEAMACGVVPVSGPIAGVAALLDGVDDQLLASELSPIDIARIALPLLTRRDAALRHAVVKHSGKFGYTAAAQRLLTEYRRST